MKVLSLFSGIGAFEKALSNIEAEYEIVGFSEIDRHAIKSYCAIHKISDKLNIGNIDKVNYDDIPYFDIMTYGFPCQSFSEAGNRLGMNDPDKGHLFMKSASLANHFKPKVLLAENVKGLITHDSGKTFQTVLSTLDSTGYNNYYSVLNSSYFGVPQHRERIFIVSIRKDIDNGTFHMPVHNARTSLAVKDIVDTSCKNRKLKESMVKFLDEVYHREYVSCNGIKKVFDGVSQGYFDSDYSGKRLYSVNGYAPTFVANKSDAHQFFELRGKLNALERFRLQGFSDEDYEVSSKVCSESQLIKQAGNSITVPVLEAIFKNIKNSIEI